MIWIDSSYAIDHLTGHARARDVDISHEPWVILPAQYAEILVWFGKRTADLGPVVEQLQGIALREAQRPVLLDAAGLYLGARQQGSKASLADALMAADCQRHKGKIASFDQDLGDLGMWRRGGLWVAASAP